MTSGTRSASQKDDAATYMDQKQSREDRLVETVEELVKGVRDMAEENNQMRAAVGMYKKALERVEKQRDENMGAILLLQARIRQGE